MEAKCKLVKMTAYQYEKIRKYDDALLELSGLLDKADCGVSGWPESLLKLLASGIADVFEDIDAGRLNHGKSIRPVPEE